MEYCKMKEEQTKRLSKFNSRDKKAWKAILDNCTICKSELICFDVFCAMVAVGNESRKESLIK